jgi:putative membrane protein
MLNSQDIFITLVRNPDVYLKKLLTRTALIGAVCFFLLIILKFTGFENFQIPSTLHGLVGIVMGLLLVFRTNSAYDRWWDGRKLIGNLITEVEVFAFRVKGQPNNTMLLSTLDGYLRHLKTNLVTNGYKLHKNYYDVRGEFISNILKYLESYNEHDKRDIEAGLFRILDISNSLIRIKTSPIPLSYMLHIKVSLMIYLLTLPFGLFHDLGFFAIPMVMVLFYIIAGVEIISNEIEQPFAGDPNDLPMDSLFNIMSSSINKIGYR